MKEPDTLSIRRYFDEKGICTIFIRLIDISGNGIQSEVSLEFEHKVYKINTDASGIATFTIPREIPVGYSSKVIVFTNGIKKHATLKIENTNKERPKSFTPKWFFATYNGRTIIFVVIMISLWIFCGSIGFGSSLIDTAFNSELSSAQIYYNKNVTNPENLIQTPVLETWQHKYWLLAFLWTIFTFSYIVYAFIKSLYLVMIQWVENVTDISEDSVHKPLFDMAALWTGAIDRVSNREPNTSKNSEVNFWTIVNANLLSTVFVVLGYKVFKMFFK
jgi:hypothetical protein